MIWVYTTQLKVTSISASIESQNSIRPQVMTVNNGGQARGPLTRRSVEGEAEGQYPVPQRRFIEVYVAVHRGRNVIPAPEHLLGHQRTNGFIVDEDHDTKVNQQGSGEEGQT